MVVYKFVIFIYLRFLYHIRISFMASYRHQPEERFFKNALFSNVFHSCTLESSLWVSANIVISLSRVSSWSLQFINPFSFCTVAKRNSWSPLQQNQIAVAVWSNKSSKAGSPACHSLPLFCKSRIARCTANRIFYLLIYLFAIVNVPTREYPPPSLHSIAIKATCSSYWGALHTIKLLSLKRAR